MANSVFQIKRTSVSGRAANSTTLTRAGELALNMADGILYSTNGTTIFEVGANNTNVRINGNATFSVNNKRLGFTPLAGGSNVYFIQQNDDNFVFYSTNSINQPRAVFSIFANSVTSNLNFSAPVNFSANVGSITANGSTGSAGQVLASNGTTVYWTTGGGSGTVTSVASGNGLTGGPITGSGTLSVSAQTPLVANTTGLHIATSAGNGTFTSGISAITVDSVGRVTSVTGSAGYVTSSGVTSVATGNGMTGGTITTTGTVSILANTGVVANATGLFVNATYIGTLTANNTSFLGGVAAASYVQNTDSRTLSGNINFTGVNNFFTGATLGGTAGNIGNNITLFNSVGGNAGNFRFYTERNATGADWTTASARLQYRIDVTDMGYMEFNPPNASGVTSGQGLAFGGTDATEAMRITAAGSVGIGNTAPQEKLHVAGAIVTSGATAANKTAGASFDYSSGFGGGRILSWGPVGTNSTLSFWSGSGGGGAVERFRFDTVGNFGIGNATPSHKLRVEGDISLLSGVHANGSFGTSGQVLTTNGTVAYWASASGGGYYKGGSAAVGTLAAGGQNLFRVNANTLNFNTTIVAGENASATGPITVASGITLTVESGGRVSIV